MPVTITLDDDIWEKIVKLKLKLKVKTYSEALERMFKLIKYHKLAKELEEIK